MDSFLSFLQMRHQNWTSQKPLYLQGRDLKLPLKDLQGAISSQLRTSFSSTSFPWEVLIEGRWYWMIVSGNLHYLITSENPQSLMTMLFLWTLNFFLKPSPALSLYCVQTILWRKWDKYSHICPSDSRGSGTVSQRSSQALASDWLHALLTLPISSFAILGQWLLFWASVPSFVKWVFKTTYFMALW